MVAATLDTDATSIAKPRARGIAALLERLDMDDPRSLALVAAFVQAVADAEAVTKDAFNPHHRFHYATAEAKIARAKFAFTKNGLTIITASSRVVGRDDQRYLLRDYVLVHVQGGHAEFDAFEWPIIPQNGRPLDKAVATAGTASFADFLRTELLIPCEADEDLSMDSRDDRDYQARRRRREPPRDDAPPPLDDLPPPDDDDARTDGARRMDDADVAMRYATHCDRATSETALVRASALPPRLRPEARTMCEAYERFTVARLNGEEWRATRLDVESVKSLCAWRDLDAPWEAPRSTIPAPTIIDDAPPAAGDAAASNNNPDTPSAAR